MTIMEKITIRRYLAAHAMPLRAELGIIGPCNSTLPTKKNSHSRQS